jgi:hypothetical protein
VCVCVCVRACVILYALVCVWKGVGGWGGGTDVVSTHIVWVCVYVWGIGTYSLDTESMHTRFATGVITA